MSRALRRLCRPSASLRSPSNGSCSRACALRWADRYFEEGAQSFEVPQVVPMKSYWLHSSMRLQLPMLSMPLQLDTACVPSATTRDTNYYRRSTIVTCLASSRALLCLPPISPFTRAHWLYVLCMYSICSDIFPAICMLEIGSELRLSHS